MKVEVYKDSKGNLHEKEDDYLLAELKIETDNAISLHERWLSFMEVDPTNHYLLLQYLAKLIKETPDFDETLNERIELLQKAKEIRRKNIVKEGNSCSANSNWNDSPGEWLGISAQDLGVPNC